MGHQWGMLVLEHSQVWYKQLGQPAVRSGPWPNLGFILRNFGAPGAVAHVGCSGHTLSMWDFYIIQTCSDFGVIGFIWMIWWNMV